MYKMSDGNFLLPEVSSYRTDQFYFNSESETSNC